MHAQENSETYFHSGHGHPGRGHWGYRHGPPKEYNHPIFGFGELLKVEEHRTLTVHCLINLLLCLFCMRNFFVS